MNFEEILPGRREWEVFENIVSKIIKNTLTLRFPRIRPLRRNKLVFIDNKEVLQGRGEWEAYKNSVSAFLSKIIKTLTLPFPRIRPLQKNKLVLINKKETLPGHKEWGVCRFLLGRRRGTGARWWPCRTCPPWSCIVPAKVNNKLKTSSSILQKTYTVQETSILQKE